ncbi:MAG: hypothetical protein U9N46_14315, partial [Euryarchaeota archaeon]|nr:hypothetical protein [Euryarchaeota archaeon]
NRGCGCPIRTGYRGSLLRLLDRQGFIVKRLDLCKLHRKRWHHTIPDDNCRLYPVQSGFRDAEQDQIQDR